MGSSPDKLIVVCCHGIWLGGLSKGSAEHEWLIADFQRGETTTFVEHIVTGVRLLSADRERSVLVFSGETHLSEAKSYANLAHENAYFSLLDPIPVLGKDMLLEERALDSYHNILFSLTLFRDHFGQRWPAQVTIVSHAFKEARIMKHVRAIGFPVERVRFVGIDPETMQTGTETGTGTGPVWEGVAQAERDWDEDPRGKGEKLAGKRARRNVWGVWQGVFVRPSGDEEEQVPAETDDFQGALFADMARGGQ